MAEGPYAAEIARKTPSDDWQIKGNCLQTAVCLIEALQDKVILAWKDSRLMPHGLGISFLIAFVWVWASAMTLLCECAGLTQQQECVPDPTGRSQERAV